MGLVVAIVCGLLVVVPLIVLAGIARQTVGRLGQLLSHAQPVQDGINTLSTQLTTLTDTMSGIRPRGGALDVSH